MTDRMRPSGESRYYSPTPEDHGVNHVKTVGRLIPGKTYILHQPALTFEYGRSKGLVDQPRVMVAIVPDGAESHIDPDEGVYARLATKPNSKKMVTSTVDLESMGMEPGQNGYLRGVWVEEVTGEKK